MGRKQRPILSVQQKTKAMRATTYAILFLIWMTLSKMIEKRSEHRLKKEIFIFVKNIVLSKNWFVASIFYEFKSSI